MLWTAFILGFVGSFHCLGMCGPIAMAMQGKQGNHNHWHTVLERLLYNLGRSVTYALLGGIAGLLGKSLVWLIGYQVYIAAILGVMLLLVGLFSVNPETFLMKIPVLGSWFGVVRKQLGKLLREAGLHNFFTIGLLNGFLPCGLVYMALVNAVAIGSMTQGMSYMLMFGIGTMPLMLSAALAGQFVSMNFRNHVKRLYPYVFVLMGGLLIFRAYNVGTSSNITDDMTLSNKTEMICH
ncbi:sulfite exporter TauE/SafE family protein [Limibacter armeniacum]|uniref:sulfite exporter TauE/SafE family protein n=1 Tax=Limibacter armeniacum TaxID=466084 RepID=UPI002FE5740E